MYLLISTTSYIFIYYLQNLMWRKQRVPCQTSACSFENKKDNTKERMKKKMWGAPKLKNFSRQIATGQGPLGGKQPAARPHRYSTTSVKGAMIYLHFFSWPTTSNPTSLAKTYDPKILTCLIRTRNAACGRLSLRQRTVMIPKK